MQLDSKRPLAKGQVWKMRAADIEIVAVGKRLIHYRVTRQLGAKEVSAQLSGIGALEDYLKRNAAVRVKGGADQFLNTPSPSPRKMLIPSRSPQGDSAPVSSGGTGGVQKLICAR